MCSFVIFLASGLLEIRYLGRIVKVFEKWQSFIVLYCVLLSGWHLVWISLSKVIARIWCSSCGISWGMGDTTVIYDEDCTMAVPEESDAGLAFVMMNYCQALLCLNLSIFFNRLVFLHQIKDSAVCFCVDNASITFLVALIWAYCHWTLSVE